MIEIIEILQLYLKLHIYVSYGLLSLSLLDFNPVYTCIWNCLYGPTCMFPCVRLNDDDESNLIYCF